MQYSEDDSPVNSDKLAVPFLQQLILLCTHADNPNAGGIAGNIGINNYHMANPLICSQVSHLHLDDPVCLIAFVPISSVAALHVSKFE